ncbi:nitrogenase molybdenum-iron protein alpha chain [Propionibacterium cyclohexanicum]|uniref:Nitrogenase protein alpha chain n=1 Tax=Propionibacterium cyclohexanicum TaxID=64702 RepID=A0A1H9TYY2_9ACTN|nr:nitrogenase molybdenum-iron protein alpha chain [Propionibacterium cyclohexanicum]SES02326.1 nitrogenase molybdenum-iron protein alpha chain [Propionibacterium cyclohexanicum]
MKKPQTLPAPPAEALATVDLAAVAALDLVTPETAVPLPQQAPVATDLVEDLVKPYPVKVKRKRAKHITVNDPDEIPPIEANVRSTPGIITTRGCCYAGCKGVVLGPITDVIHIVHGPIGCSYYAWMTRRNQADVPESEQDFLKYCFSTDMTTNEIVFGGEKKLAQAVREAYEIFHPKAIDIFSTCPVGLIGDDVHAVAREARKELKIPVFAFSCEGYKGVSQSAGHHIANNGLFKNVVGTEELPAEAKTNPFRVNMLGEYNIGGDAFEIERLLNACGIQLVATFSGNAQLAELAHSQDANLNLIQCHRSINYMATMMETKYGIPWLKVNFIGAEATAKTLRKIARYFGDDELTARVEIVIAEELAKVEPVRQAVRARVEGRPVMLFVGGSRSHHYQSLFRDMGMPVVTAGYEFAHRDDYEGYQVASTIKVDADSRNIEELTVEADPEHYRARKSPEELERLKASVDIADYKGMMPEMAKGAMVVDDISHHELEQLIETYHPALVCSGIKDKYVVEKMGIPCKQLHNYDYGGPYAGFRGAVNFYQEIDRMVNSPVWGFIPTPWEKQSA